jgi:hypothetical protein
VGHHNERVAVEDAVPLDAEVFAAKREESLYETADGGNFFTLTYNEQHAPADQWFLDHGWQAAATPLNGYMSSVGRPVPEADSDAGVMSGNISLVSAMKG